MATFRLLWHWAHPHRTQLAVATCLGLVAAGAGLALPWATKFTIDQAHDVSDLWGPVAGLAGLLIAGVLLGLAQRIVLARVSERIVQTARMRMVDRVLAARVGSLGAHPGGELVTRVTADPGMLRDATGAALVGIVSNCVTVVGAVVLMWLLDWVLLVTTVLALVGLGALIGLTLRPLRHAHEQTQSAIARLGAILDGTVRAIRTIKAGNAELRVRDRLATEAASANRFAVRAVWLEAAGMTIASAGIQLALVAVLGVGAWRVSAGALEVSSLVAFILYVITLVQPVSGLSEDVSSITSGLAAAERIRDITELPAERSGGQAPKASRLRLRNVTVRYPGTPAPALHAIDYGFPERGHCALVGPSGAGKTTAFSVLLGLVDPEEGDVVMDDKPYSTLSLAGIRSMIAYVEQETPLLPGTLRDNLLLRAPETTDQELWAVLEQVRLADRIRTIPEGLDAEVSAELISGGERQRIGLARALLRPPPILLLDEATAQLDALTEQAVSAVVRERAREGLVITIAHRLSTVIEADQILVLDQGRLRAVGNHRELLERDALYADLVAALRIAKDQQAG